MPLYSYTNPETGKTIERAFPMSGERPKRITAEGKVYLRDIAADHRGASRTSGCWPMISDFGGVHPNQIAGMSADLANKGVPTEFTPMGDVIHPDRAHRRKYHKARGLVDLGGGYGDSTEIINDKGD